MGFDGDGHLPRRLDTDGPVSTSATAADELGRSEITGARRPDACRGPGTWSGTAPIAFGVPVGIRRSNRKRSANRRERPDDSAYRVSSSDAGSSSRVVVTASNAGRQRLGDFGTHCRSCPVPPPRCVVPSLKGKTVAKARVVLRRAHCALGRVSSARSSLRRGLIVAQHPRARALRPRGTKVSVVVSRGRHR